MGIDFFTSDDSTSLINVSNIFFFLLNLKTEDQVIYLLVREDIKHRPLPVDWCQDPVNTLACQPRQSFDSVDFILFRKTLLIKNINDAQTQITLKQTSPYY